MQVALHKINTLQSLYKRTQKQILLLVILITGLAMNTYAQPPNDEPCNATVITPDAVCNYQIFTNAAATASAGAPAPGCANYQGGDVWFQVTVPAASNGTLKFDTQAGVATDLGMAIYRGTCDNLQLLDCDDDSGAGLASQITLTSLTVGSVLWIRVWEYGNDNNGTFGICVKYPGPPPAYDEPCTATALPDPTTTCTYQTFTDEGATATAGAPAPGCANYTGGDVWFTVTVPPGGILKFDTQTGEVINGGMAIYSGTCDNLTLIACDDDASPNGAMPQIINTTLTPGSTVWIRFWSNGLTNNVGSFGLCVSIPPPPPVNDEACDAILLTVTNVCSYQTFTTEASTPSAGAPAPGCANYQGGDVWFKAVVPCEGSITVNTTPGVITDGGMAIYRGTCDNMQLLDCDDDSSPNGLMPYISLTSLTPGSTIFIRVWEYGNDNPGTFGICVTVPPPPPPTGNCFGAQSFCSSNTYTYPNTTNVPSLGGGGIYGCLGSTPNPAWFYMQVQNPGNMSILIQQNSTATGNPIDVDYCLWGPFPNLPAACGNLSASNIVSCSYSTAGIETATLPNGQTGDYYVLLITNFANQPGTVTFNQTSGTGSTNCDIVCTLTAGNNGPVCAGGTVDLTATDVPGATYQWNGPMCFNQTALSTEQNPQDVPVPDEPGTYIFTVIATSPGGSTCFAQTAVVVIARPAIGNDTTKSICVGTTQDLSAIYSTLTGLTTAWTNVSDGSPVSDPAAAGAGVYQVIGSNASGCNDTAVVTIVIDQVAFDVTSTGNATCTLPGEITVSNPIGIGGLSTFLYNIDTSPGVFVPTNIFTAPPGNYVITTRDSLGCEATMPITVGFTNDMTASATPTDVTICADQTTTLHAISSDASTTFAWLPATGLNDPTSADPIASPTNTTVYTVTATLGACTQTATVNVTVDNDLVVDAGGPYTVIGGTTQQINATVTGTNTTLSGILWTPSDGLSATNTLTPVLTPVIANGTSTYTITVTNSNGCTATDDMVVNISSELGCRNVRNAFSPNGDGKNDYWLVYDEYACLTNVTVSVFNRYGSKVFDSKDYRNDWNGTYKGKTLPDGTYYAIVEFTLRTGKHITVKTDLTIIR